MRVVACKRYNSHTDMIQSRELQINRVVNEKEYLISKHIDVTDSGFIVEHVRDSRAKSCELNECKRHANYNRNCDKSRGC